jgi:hypothetical protein
MAVLGCVLVAASPFAVVAVIVMLSSRSATRNAVAFLAGWFAVLIVIGAAGLLGTASVDFAPQSSGSLALAWIELAGAAALGIYVAFRLRRRQQPATTPRWLEAAEHIRTPAAFALGAFLPTYAIALSAVAEVLHANHATAAGFAAYLVFVAVSTVLLATPLIVAVSSHEHADERLAALKAWVICNSTTLVTVLLSALALLLLVRGLSGIAHA